MKQSDSVDKIRNKVETITVIYGSKCEPNLEKADSFGSNTLNKPRTVYHKIQNIASLCWLIQTFILTTINKTKQLSYFIFVIFVRPIEIIDISIIVLSIFCSK